MNTSSKLELFSKFKLIRFQVLAGPILLLMILSMMILPLSPFVLDLFFTFNIALSIIVLLVAMFTTYTLEFTAFPTILLFSTLLRLSLNIASTRIILLYGHNGSYSAGKVIHSFGHFLVGGNYAIGIIVFIILVIINFSVITKGASRIAEVGARFILDGMPGKQMAIDADLNAGLIGEKQATQRRTEITQEADFYGSMDGASKFVRGDAIAGILIMIVNILGGLIVGMMQHDMLFLKAIQVYTLLTIGDGLVAQIPALVISTASGVIVTRVSTDQNISEQMISQLFFNPQVIFLSGIVLGILGLVPGMPNMIFLLFTSILIFLSWLIYNNPDIFQFSALKKLELNSSESIKLNDASWNDVQLEDSVGIELGLYLIPMVSNSEKKNDLLNNIRNIRKKFTKQIGFLPPLIHIRNNENLPKNAYSILVKGIEVGKGNIQIGKFLAIDSESKLDNLTEEEILEPVFKYKAFWIDKSLLKFAREKGYNIVQDSSIIATHLNEIMLMHVNKLFGRQEAQQLLDYVAKYFPKLIEDLIPNAINLTTFHQVIQNLLIENVPIRDMQTIIETLIVFSSTHQNNPQELTCLVRIALGKLIVQTVFKNKKIEVFKLDVEIERILLQMFESKQDNIEPGFYNSLIQEIEKTINYFQSMNKPVVLLVTHNLRSNLSKLLLKIFPKLIILSNLELEDTLKINIINIIGSKKSV